MKRLIEELKRYFLKAKIKITEGGCRRSSWMDGGRQRTEIEGGKEWTAWSLGGSFMREEDMLFAVLYLRKVIIQI